MAERLIDRSWQKIFDDLNLKKHNFNKNPCKITAEQIKTCCQDFRKTGEKEVRILCKQDSREKRPEVFIKNNLFLLPVKNGEYVIVKGEGYVDIPEIKKEEEIYVSSLDFTLDTSLVGDSEMQHLDFAYASSLIRTFMKDDSLVLTIRGRKYTPAFSFKVGSHNIDVQSVQTEVDAGYEGKKQVILIEAKNSRVRNTIIRQLYYPYRQWSERTKKKVIVIFFEKTAENIYSLWQFGFRDTKDYNSIYLIKSGKYRIKNKVGQQTLK
jgi:hypothetical protein